MENYIYTVNVDSDEPIMLINSHIGFDDELGYGVIGSIFQRELLYLDNLNKKRIQVWINSPGGNVSDGYDIYSSIIKTKTKVDTYCTGIAASIAGVIFQAGRKRYMMDYSNLMYHNPYGGSDAKTMETLTDSIAQMIASRTGKNIKVIKNLMAKTTYMNSQEALDNGFCDEVENSGEMNKKRSISNDSEAKAAWKEYYQITNNLLKIDNMDAKEFQKINNKLSLNPDASIESAISAIDALVAAKNKAEEDCKNAKNEEDKVKSELEKKKDELKKAQDEVDKIKSELDKMKSEMEEQDKKNKAKDEEDKKNKAKDLVKNHASKLGDIKNLELWEAKAIADFEGTKNLLESLPINKKAAVIDLGQNSANGTPVVGSVIASTMAKNLEKSLANK